MNHQACVAAVVAGVVSCGVSGGVVLTAQPIGSAVVISGGGTLDLSSWSPSGAAGLNPWVNNAGSVGVGPIGSGIDLYSGSAFDAAGLAGSTSGFGSPFLGTLWADSGTGDAIGIGVGSGPAGNILVPNGYSGATLAGSATFLNESITSLGLVAGTHMWTWNTASGGSDFFTFIIVPTPGVLGAVAIASVGCVRRRR